MWNPCRDEWLPSYGVIHLDYVVIEQKPAPTIVAISEGVLAAFHSPKGRTIGLAFHRGEPKTSGADQ